MHARQTLRDKVVILLDTNKVKYNSVLASRLPSARQLWPYIMVFAESETVLSSDVNQPCTYIREVTLATLAMLRIPNRDAESVEDAIDAVSLEIENKMLFSALQALVPKLQDLKLVNTTMELITLDDESIDHAELKMLWRVSYATAEGAAQTLL